MHIKQIPTGRWRENCYVVSNDQKEALIIDPGNDELTIQTYIEKNKLKVYAILNTHGHYDHIGAVQYLKKINSIPFYLHSNDFKLMKSANLYVKIFDGTRLVEIPSVDYFIDEIETPHWIGKFCVDIIPTPGHTSGSVCIYIDEFLFTGDTLLKGMVGRLDLPGADKSAIKTSLATIAQLPKKTKVYPGHGQSTTINKESKTLMLT